MQNRQLPSVLPVQEEPAPLETHPDSGAPLSDPDDLRSRALTLLDFDAVRQRLADRTTFFPAHQMALRLTPSYDELEVEQLQRETEEGRVLLDHVGDISLHAGADTTQSVARAALGGALTGMELLEVDDSLEVQQRARTGVLRAETHAPLLAAIASGIPDLHELSRQIRLRIGSRGEVVDDATPTLRVLRSQVRQAYERVAEALTRIIQSSAGQEALQDQVISVRGDRLVVQVKAEMRRRVPGIVHDASNTGATLFIEPSATVDMCNAWRELALEEEREVARVLRDLSALVGTLGEDIRRGNELAATLDFILARARYSEALGGARDLQSTRQAAGGDSSDGPGLKMRLLKARHPLLGESAVPINIGIGPGWLVLVITGPNTGGKTVAMKAVGLLALMHQSGIQVPVDEGSSLSVFDGIYADVGDQQSIEQSVSTFGSHMLNVIDILSEAGPNSLVLLDELGTSTDPEEGSALAKAILDHLASEGISTIATTHHRSVAAHAEASPAMMNASVTLDADTLRPTYLVTMGIPGRSYAMSVASHLGLPETIMENAQALLEPQYLRFEDWLSGLQNERSQLQTRLQEAEQALAQAESMKRDVDSEHEYLRSHREELVSNMRGELLGQYEDIRGKIRRAEAALSWAAPPRDLPRDIAKDLRDATKEVSALKQDLDAPIWKPPPEPAREDDGPIAVDDIVHVRGLNLRGTVVSLAEQVGEAEVNVGSVRLRLDLSRLSKAEPEPQTETPGVHFRLGPSLASSELDIRGLRAAEAQTKLEDFIDKAVRDGFSSIRIIHGRGTGALKNMVREHLTHHSLAKSFDEEVPERGGAGVTTVELA